MFLGQRPSSTKTRIKTRLLKLIQQTGFVRDHLPLKQGLRLVKLWDFAEVYYCQRPSSTKTRIKTKAMSVLLDVLQVRDHLPLKQGLRPCKGIFMLLSLAVRDHLPLKQGLRPKLTFLSITVI